MKQKHITIILLCVLMITIVLIGCENKHVHAWTTSIETQPGCETEGVLLKKCPCGAIERDVIPALGHKDAEEFIKKAPTCTEAGLKQMICPVCKKVFEEEVIPATGHQPGEVKIIKAPTCTELGEKEAFCKTCGVSLGKEEIAAKGHTWGTDSITKEPTCTEPGERTIKCTECGLKKEGEVIPALGHTEELIARVKIAPDCETEGVMEYVCMRCQTAIEGKDTPIPALGHNWGDYKVKKAPTCMTEGLEVATCTRHPEHTRTRAIPKLPHDFEHGISKIVQEADCTQQGIIETKCKNCNTINVSYIPKKPHVWAPENQWTWKDGQPADEFHDGILIKKCLNCSATEEVLVKATHVHKTAENCIWDTSNKYGNNISATCISEGKIIGYCTCFEDEAGNIYVEWAEGRTPHKVAEKVEGKDSHNHVHKQEMVVSEAGYFSGKLTQEICLDCNKVINTLEDTSTQVPFEGNWKMFMPNIPVPGYDGVKGTIAVDITRSTNNNTVFYADVFGQDYVENQINTYYSSLAENLRRTVNGMWYASTTMDTSYTDDETPVKFIQLYGQDFVKVLKEDVSAENIWVDLQMEYSLDPSTACNKKSNDMPIGTIGLQNKNIDSSCFTNKAENEITLSAKSDANTFVFEWLPIDSTNDDIASIQWKSSGKEVGSGASYKITGNSSDVFNIECTVTLKDGRTKTEATRIIFK